MLPDTQFVTFARAERGVSEAVGITLLVGIVVIGMAVILVVGGGQVADDREAVETGQAEQALVQFDDDAQRVAGGGTTTRRVDLGLRVNDGTLDVEEDAGRVTVEYFDPFDPINGTEVTNTTMGAVVYESGDTTVAYQGGGVWRSDGNGSVMVSPPEITSPGKTLNMPVVETRKAGSVHSDVQVRRVDTTEQFPNRTRDANLTNKVDEGIVEITIESRYYRAWGRYFEDETDAEVIYPPNEDAVIVMFFGSRFNLGQEAGIIATSGPGELRVEGDGSYIDSYNSSEGPYSESNSDNGVVKSAGDIDLFGGANISGDAESNRKIILDGSSEITGDACANDGVYINSDDATVGGSTNCSANVPILPPLDGLVESRTDELASQNDNDATEHIDGRRLNFSGADEVELQPGNYYLEKIELEDNETVVLNASRGDFNIAVEDYVVLDQGNIEITGNKTDGDVRMYIASEESSGITVSGTGGEPADHFYVDGNSKVWIQNDTAPRFQILAPSTFTGAIRASGSDEPQVTASILAPTPSAGPSQFIVRDAELFGAVVTGNLSTENNGEVHFDRGIYGEEIPFGENGLIDFFYLTHHELEVKGE
jgi:FlaG/FlaF family flagellin (archaellin)